MQDLFHRGVQNEHTAKQYNDRMQVEFSLDNPGPVYAEQLLLKGFDQSINENDTRRSGQPAIFHSSGCPA